MKNLLETIRKYPIGEIDPLENFLTEAWAWTLSKYENLSSEYIKWIFEIQDENLEWSTQNNYNGYIDLLSRSEANIFIFEHKIDAGFQVNQLERYFKAVVKRHPNQNVNIAIISRSNTSYQLNGDKVRCKTWAEVTTWLDRYLNTLSEDQIEENFVINNIIDLLKNEGLGPMKPINIKAIENYYEVYGLENQLKGLFRSLKDNTDWKPIMKHCPRNDSDEKMFSPRSVQNRRGRIGIEFSKPIDWAPGLFFGVVLDPDDHGFSPPEHGPDLCFIVSFSEIFHKTYETLEEFQSLKRELLQFEQVLKNWSFYDHLSDKNANKKNRSQPLYLRRPLSDFIKGLKDEDQAESLRNEFNAFMHSFFEYCPSYLKLRSKLKNL